MTKKKSPPLHPKASDPGLSNADISLLRLHLRASIEKGLQLTTSDEIREYCRENITESSSLDSLFRALTALGYDVVINIEHRDELDGYARIQSNLFGADDSETSLN